MVMKEEEEATTPEAVLDCIDAYNFAIADIANCPNIADLAKRVRETLSRMILSGHMQESRRPRAQMEHRQIVAAIAAGDGILAQSLTIQHLTNAGRATAIDADINEEADPKQDKE